MVVLKRIRASTLMETLVATVLIIIIFMVASMLLNNMFANSINARNQDALEHLNRLKYKYEGHYLKLPYYGELGVWEITVTKRAVGGINTVEFRAENQQTHKLMVQNIIDEN
ncbi:hypothetical protein QSE00_23770 [Arenibacter sp. M-2]|uniref:hypothetical protein n=1 Tax=Arenibacter sp. M-2 TaxID=3053612 RepID=UPI00257101F6|nr:hypothetical protein [Arenibacter sp. M-2]MDL5514849.1 hypothetical protein [Arenibacter sp. M-2]